MLWDVLSHIEKLKYPGVAFLVGCGAAWVLSSYIHDERINQFKESQDESRRKAEEQDKLIANQQNELAAYKQKLEAAETANAAMRSRSGTDWQKILSNIDKEIENKRRQIAREKAYYAGPMVPGVGTEGKKRPKPETLLLDSRVLCNQELNERTQ